MTVIIRMVRRTELVTIVTILWILLLLITTTTIMVPVYGLMTKEKVEGMLTTMAKLRGEEPPIPPEQRLEGLTHEQKLALLSNSTMFSSYTNPEQRLGELTANATTKYQTYEEAWLEITNEHFGTNYTSYEEAALGLYEKALHALENPSLYYWPPYVPMPLLP